MDEEIILEALKKMESVGLVEHQGGKYRLTTAGSIYAHMLLRSKPEAWLLLTRLLRSTMNLEEAIDTLTATILTVFFNLKPDEAKRLVGVET